MCHATLSGIWEHNVLSRCLGQCINDMWKWGRQRHQFLDTRNTSLHSEDNESPRSSFPPMVDSISKDPRHQVDEVQSARLITSYMYRLLHVNECCFKLKALAGWSVNIAISKVIWAQLRAKIDFIGLCVAMSVCPRVNLAPWRQRYCHTRIPQLTGHSIPHERQYGGFQLGWAA